MLFKNLNFNKTFYWDFAKPDVILPSHLLKSCFHPPNFLRFQRPAAVYSVTPENPVVCESSKATEAPKSIGAVTLYNTALLWLGSAPLLINAGTIKNLSFLLDV